jgi:Mrp family chromosome partitioning ATPase
MNKSVDVMQEIEKGEATRASSVMEGFSVPEDNGRQDARELRRELTIGLVQRMFHPSVKEKPCVVVFAGIDPGCGCSEIALSVAETLALKSPGRVCLVEANLRSPGLSRPLKTANARGLSNALVEEGSVWSFLKPVWEGRIWFLSAGPTAADSPDLLYSERLGTRLAELRKEFEYVIVDAPPINQYSDAMALGQLSDGVVLILEANATRREAAMAATDGLRSSGIPILGAVLNKRTFPIPEGLYKRL